MYAKLDHIDGRVIPAHLAYHLCFDQACALLAKRMGELPKRVVAGAQ
jgi:hypothetical protein